MTSQKWHWRNLFNLKTTALDRPEPSIPRGSPQPSSAQRDTEESKGVFITGQSLMTFPVATTVILVAWRTIESLVPTLKGWLLVPAILALLLGVFFIFVALTDANTEKTRKAIVTAVVVGIVNAFYLFASATGILGSLNADSPPPPTQRAAIIAARSN